MNSRTKLLVSILFISLCLVARQKTEGGQIGHGFENFKFVTDDSLTLNAEYYTSYYRGPAPLVILLHMYGEDNHSLYEILLEFADQYCWGSSVEILDCPDFLAFDLRGHGKSNQIGDSTFVYENMSKNDFKKIPDDVTSALEDFFEKNKETFDTSRVSIIGSSLGANVAIMVTEKLPIISRVVLVSPAENIRGLEPAESLKKYRGEILIVTGERDDISNQSCKRFAKLYSAKIELKSFDTKNHGTDLISHRWKGAHKVKEEMKYLVEWLNRKNN